MAKVKICWLARQNEKDKLWSLFFCAGSKDYPLKDISFCSKKDAQKALNANIVFVQADIKKNKQTKLL